MQNSKKDLNISQDSDTGTQRECYERAINTVEKLIDDRLSSEKINIANFGSGSKFVFEKELNDKFGDRVQLYATDLCEPTNIPDYINYMQGNVEESIKFDTKMNIVTFFELIEHIDKTDELLKNCYNNLLDNGLLICSCPNLSSIYCRLELLLGYQPHLLETSNEYHTSGMGIFGKINYGKNEALHHIRGLTYRALREMLNHHGFEIQRTYGYTNGLKFIKIPALSSDVLYICKK